ncbi:MAG: hypothetical protein ACRD0L_16515 [Acidimicrobiales bacterium]
MRARAVGKEHGPPHRELVDVVTEWSVVDDAGRPYRLGLDGGRLTHRRPGEGQALESWWEGDLVGEPASPRDASWLELAPAGAGRAERVVLSPPPVPVGRAEPPWPTPGECYLARLVPRRPVGRIGVGLGPEEAAEVVATVADAPRGRRHVAGEPVAAPAPRCRRGGLARRGGAAGLAGSVAVPLPPRRGRRPRCPLCSPSG